MIGGVLYHSQDVRKALKKISITDSTDDEGAIFTAT